MSWTAFIASSSPVMGGSSALIRQNSDAVSGFVVSPSGVSGGVSGAANSVSPRSW